MSAERMTRALARLARSGAVLAPERSGSGFGVFSGGDRRRRPAARLNADEVRALEADGSIAAQAGGGFALTPAGAARVAREQAAPDEGFVAQHAAIVARHVIDEDGDIAPVRGVDPAGLMRRLAALRDGAGRPWLNDAELAAANRLRADWAAGEVGLVRGSDWTAAPMGTAPRGAGNAQERAMARRCDARRRMGDALACLAPPLRRVVDRVCFHEDGLEALERSQGWPARSGKLALKLALAQLAAAL